VNAAYRRHRNTRSSHCCWRNHHSTAPRWRTFDQSRTWRSSLKSSRGSSLIRSCDISRHTTYYHAFNQHTGGTIQQRWRACASHLTSTTPPIVKKWRCSACLTSVRPSTALITTFCYVIWSSRSALRAHHWHRLGRSCTVAHSKFATLVNFQPSFYCSSVYHRGRSLGRCCFYCTLQSCLMSSQVLDLLDIRTRMTHTISAPAASTSTTTQTFVECVERVDAWMSSNRLRMNADKMQLVWLGTRQQLDKLSTTELSPLSARVQFSRTVSDLGVLIDGNRSAVVRFFCFALSQVTTSPNDHASWFTMSRASKRITSISANTELTFA